MRTVVHKLHSNARSAISGGILRCDSIHGDARSRKRDKVISSIRGSKTSCDGGDALHVLFSARRSSGCASMRVNGAPGNSGTILYEAVKVKRSTPLEPWTRPFAFRT
ncbi:hypothetical protein IG631_00105 [Alternaria alternata]|nr:hypothetical protein IG631_00105 [Alternaria alternata]